MSEWNDAITAADEFGVEVAVLGMLTAVPDLEVSHRVTLHAVVATVLAAVRQPRHLTDRDLSVADVRRRPPAQLRPTAAGRFDPGVTARFSRMRR